MKKMVIGIVTLCLTVTSSFAVMAGPGGPPKHGSKYHGWEEKKPHYGPRERQYQSDARYIIERTAKVLDYSQHIARNKHRYFGFALATAHQQKARELYADGEYRDAIYFSLRSRKLAFQIIQNNKERWRSEFNPDDRERRYHDGPRGEELDERIDRKKVDRDDDAIHFKIELHI